MTTAATRRRRQKKPPMRRRRKRATTTKRRHRTPPPFRATTRGGADDDDDADTNECDLADIYQTITTAGHYKKRAILGCRPYLVAPLTDLAPPAVFAATINNVTDSAQVRAAKRRMFTEILNDLEEDAVAAVLHNPNITKEEARIRAGAGLWVRRGGNGIREPNCNAFEELLHQRNPHATALSLAQVLTLAPATVPRALLRPMEKAVREKHVPITDDTSPPVQDDDDFAAAAADTRPLLLAALIVHCVTVLAAVPFKDTLPCLLRCLAHTSAKERTGSLVRTRVTVREFTLLSYCCFHRRQDYAMFILQSAVPREALADYVCVLDKAGNSVHHYATTAGLREVLVAMRHLPPCLDYAATPGLPEESVGTKRKRLAVVSKLVGKDIVDAADNDDVTGPLPPPTTQSASSSSSSSSLMPPPPPRQHRQQQQQQSASSSSSSSPSSSSSSSLMPPPPPLSVFSYRRRGQSPPPRQLVPDDPDEVRLSLVHGNNTETISMSHASLQSALVHAPMWAKCSYMPDATTPRHSSNGQRQLDVAAIVRESKTTQYITLQALGFSSISSITLVVRSAVVSAAERAAQKRLRDVRGRPLPPPTITLAVDGDAATVEAVALAEIEQVPVGPMRLLRSSITGAVANPFVAQAPDEQRALVQYHHLWNDHINGMLRHRRAGAGDDEDLSQNPYFGLPAFTKNWVHLGETRTVAMENVRKTQRNIDRAFRNAKPLYADLVVYRGVQYVPSAAAQAADAGNPAAGLEASNRAGLQMAFTSTSLDEDVAREFAGETSPCCLQEILLPKGMPVIYVEPLAIEHKRELEVLLPRLVELVPDTTRRRVPPTPLNPLQKVYFRAVLTPAGKEVLERPDDVSVAVADAPIHVRRGARDNDYGRPPRCDTYAVATVGMG